MRLPQVDKERKLERSHKAGFSRPALCPSKVNLMPNQPLGIVNRPQLGGYVETRCGKCKLDREHIIAALDDKGGIARVECLTCRSNHIYRERKTTTRTTSGRTSTRGTKKDSASAVEPTGPPRAYSMQERFAVGDRVEHQKFGQGVVVEVRASKIDVKFGRELKTLIHAG